MHAMRLNAIGAPLKWMELPDRQPGPGEIRVAIAACGVCRTDLHVVDGELPHPQVPVVPGHQIVGRIKRSREASVRPGPVDPTRCRRNLWNPPSSSRPRATWCPWP